jgi:cell division protein FtsN
MATRDYKRSRGARRGGFSGWTGLVIGLAAGLAAGLALHFLGPRAKPGLEPGSEAAVPEPALPASSRGTPREDSAENYDFYQMLPNFEVVVPEKEMVVPDAPADEKKGAYVLQAGSYKRFEDADRVRAQLALQGIASNVQRVAIDNDTWHRVRIGPISDPAELNRIRQRLKEAEVDFLVVRVGD